MSQQTVLHSTGVFVDDRSDLRVPFDLCDTRFEALYESSADPWASLFVPVAGRANIVPSSAAEGCALDHSLAQI